MAPHGENLCMEVRGGPLQKGVILGNLRGLTPHGDLPATGLLLTA